MILVQNRLLQLNGNKNLKSKFYIFCFLLLGCSAFVKAGTPSDSTYKIAMILPFHMYDYNGANVNRSNIMLDYYQGFYLALKEYEAKGSWCAENDPQADLSAPMLVLRMRRDGMRRVPR